MDRDRFGTADFKRFSFTHKRVSSVLCLFKGVSSQEKTDFISTSTFETVLRNHQK